MSNFYAETWSIYKSLYSTEAVPALKEFMIKWYGLPPEGFIWEDEPEKPTLPKETRTCTCDTRSLAAFGCKCGYIEWERKQKQN